ncbi:MAG: hypothetical protein ACREUG_07275 [Steroidobacteraceae bacterium]
MFKKLVPVLGLLAFVAGPVVFAADAPPASTPAATSKHTHKMATHKHHHHHKKAAKPS